MDINMCLLVGLLPKQDIYGQVLRMLCTLDLAKKHV